MFFFHHNVTFFISESPFFIPLLPLGFSKHIAKGANSHGSSCASSHTDELRRRKDSKLKARPRQKLARKQATALVDHQ